MKRSRYIIRELDGRGRTLMIFGTWFVPEYVVHQKDGRGDTIIDSMLVIGGPIACEDIIEKAADLVIKESKIQRCRVVWRRTDNKRVVRFAMTGVLSVTWVGLLQKMRSEGLDVKQVKSFGRLFG